MGRIKTKLVKRVTEELYSEHAGDFGRDFTSNKAVVDRFLIFKSRKIRNVVAGYVTRLASSQRS